MIRYTLTFFDGNRKTVLADSVSSSYSDVLEKKCYWFHKEGEIVFSSDFIASIHEEKDCCNSCSNGEECESK